MTLGGIFTVSETIRPVFGPDESETAYELVCLLPQGGYFPQQVSSP